MGIIVADVIADARMGMGIGDMSVRDNDLCELWGDFMMTSVYEVCKWWQYVQHQELQDEGSSCCRQRRRQVLVPKEVGQCPGDIVKEVKLVRWDKSQVLFSKQWVITWCPILVQH